MSDAMVNLLAISAGLIIILLLIKESIDHAGTKSDLDDTLDQIEELHVTLDRYYKEKIEAQAIADHAIDVIAEARDITTQTIHEARVMELTEEFINRRQREYERQAQAEEKFRQDVKNDIEKLTGGNS